MTNEELVSIAKKAMENSYSPYSEFKVGAAALGISGTVYTGANIENASYGATVCAERVAFFRAVQEGERDFLAIAIVGGLRNGKIDSYAFPCGICRQVMSEFCGEDFKIIVAKSLEEYQVYSLGELMPHAFGGEQIK